MRHGSLRRRCGYGRSQALIGAGAGHGLLAAILIYVDQGNGRGLTRAPDNVAYIHAFPLEPGQEGVAFRVIARSADQRCTCSEPDGGDRRVGPLATRAGAKRETHSPRLIPAWESEAADGQVPADPSDHGYIHARAAVGLTRIRGAFQTSRAPIG